MDCGFERYRYNFKELRHELYCDNKVISKVQCFTRKASFFFEKLREWLTGHFSIALNFFFLLKKWVRA